MDGKQITQRAKLLQKYLSDETKELQALYALQALMVQMEQPASKCILTCWKFFSSSILKTIVLHYVLLEMDTPHTHTFNKCNTSLLNVTVFQQKKYTVDGSVAE